MGDAPAGAAALTMRRVAVALARFRYRYADEVELHRSIGGVLTDLAIPFEHELTMPGGHRLDFLVDRAIAVEVKVAGSESDALAQVDRYCRLPDVQGALIVTTRRWGTRTLKLRGKPVSFVHITRISF